MVALRIHSRKKTREEHFKAYSVLLHSNNVQSPNISKKRDLEDFFRKAFL